MPKHEEQRLLRWTDAVSADDIYHRVQGGMTEADNENAELRAQLESAQRALHDAGIGVTVLESTELRRAAMESAIHKAVKSHDLDVLAEAVIREFERAELILSRLVLCRSDWARLQDRLWRKENPQGARRD